MTTTAEIWRLSKIFKGIDTPYYIIEGDDDRVLFRYPDGYKEMLQNKITTLMNAWRRQHPYDILNGEK